MKPLEQFLLKELASGSTSAWDWKADYYFSVQMKFEHADIILDALHSDAVWSLQCKVWDYVWRKPVTNKRTRTLNKLVKAGHATAGWQGTGHGGKWDFGVRRIRAYYITEQGKEFAAALKDEV